MRDKIADIIYLSDCDNDLSRTVEKIMDLIGPELEKARKWDMVVGIADFHDESRTCDECGKALGIENFNSCSTLCDNAWTVVQFLTAKEDGDEG